MAIKFIDICKFCFYLHHGYYPGEAPREPDNLRDAYRDSIGNKCTEHRDENSEVQDKSRKEISG